MIKIPTIITTTDDKGVVTKQRVVLELDENVIAEATLGAIISRMKALR
jgi:hypothetical protein